MIFTLIIATLLSFSPLFVAPLVAQQPPAQTQVAPAPTPPESERARSAVTLDDQVLFYVGSFKAYSSEMRARRISRALQDVADDDSISPNALTVTDDAISTDISAGDQILFSITDADASVEGISRQELGRMFLKRIGPVIEKYRRDRAPKNLLLSCLYTLLTTLAFVALMWLFFLANRRLMAWLRARVRPVQIKSHEVVRAEWILNVVTGIWRPVRLLIVFGLLIAYLQLVLSLFPWTRSFAHQILVYILVPLQAMASGIRQQIPNLLFIVVLVVVTYYLLKFVRFLFSEIQHGNIIIPGFYPDWSHLTYNIVRLLVVAFAVIVAFPYIPGSNSPAFQGISLFLGVLFSLGSTSAVANMVAGVILTYMRAFRVGDVVSIGDSTGIVTAVSILVTRMRTFKKVEITIPNSMILGTHVTNFSKASRKDGLILHTAVTIGYDTPWRQVEGLMLMAAERTSGLLREPAPFVLQTGLGDFYITYELNVATDAPQIMDRTYSELHANIQDTFNEYGVQIMSPNYVADRSVPTYVPKEHWFAAPAKPPEKDRQEKG